MKLKRQHKWVTNNQAVNSSGYYTKRCKFCKLKVIIKKQDQFTMYYVDKSSKPISWISCEDFMNQNIIKEIIE